MLDISFLCSGYKETHSNVLSFAINVGLFFYIMLILQYCNLIVHQPFIQSHEKVFLGGGVFVFVFLERKQVGTTATILVLIIC